jgi:hypothetical protein
MFRPKKSFAPYNEPLRGASRGWLEVEVRLASEFAEAVSAIWRKSSERRRPSELRRRPVEMAASHGLNAPHNVYADNGPRSQGGPSRLMPDFGGGDPPRLNGGLDYSHDFEPM